VNRRCTVIVLATLAVLAAACEPAVAQQCRPDPDVAAMDQYCSALPGADGRDTRGQALRVVVPEEIAGRLRRAGLAGEVLLGLAAAAPAETVGRAGRRSRRLDANGLVLPGDLGIAETDASAVTAVGRAFTREEGVGSGFRWVLLLSTFGLAGAAWRRFRRRSLAA
jgi:hypothetical protein